MKILGVDPGPTLTAYVLLSFGEIKEYGKIPNEEFLSRLTLWAPDVSVLEMPGMAGMAGKSVYETCYWVGRFHHTLLAMGGKTSRVGRKTSAAFWTHSGRSGDKHVRAAMISLYGGKEKAIGNKKKPGPLYGVTHDVWQALGLALYAKRTLT